MHRDAVEALIHRGDEGAYFDSRLIAENVESPRAFFPLLHHSQTRFIISMCSGQRLAGPPVLATPMTRSLYRRKPRPQCVGLSLRIKSRTVKTNQHHPATEVLDRPACR